VGTEVHDVAAAQPRQIGVVLFVFFINDLQEGLLGGLEVSRGARTEPEVPQEVVVVQEVRLDRVEVHVHVVELLEQEETRGHALPSGDRVALSRGRAHHLVEVLRDPDVVLVVCVLTDQSVHYCLQNVLFGNYAVHVLYQIESFVYVVVFQVVDNEVQSGFREDIYKWGKNLQSVFSSSEHNQIMSEEIIFLIDLARLGGVSETFKFCFGSLSIV